MSKLEDSPFTKLETVLNQADPQLIESIKEDFKHDHVCIATFSQALFEGGKPKAKLTATETPRAFMKKLGFSDDDLSKQRICMISDCEYQGELCNLMNHMIGYHKMPIHNIASTIPAIANDARKPKKGVEGMVHSVKQSGKGTD